MNFVRSLFQFLRRLEGLAIAMVLLALYVALIIAAPTVFTHPLIYISFLETFPPTLIAALGLAVLLWFILNRHKFGEGVMFIGDNANVARVMGVNVEATRIRLFALQGMIAAFAGIIVTLDIGVFYPDQGNFLLPAMASVFVGGTSIAGGAGSGFGTFFGAYVIGSLAAGVVATTISGYWVQVVEGGVMAAVVVLNAATGKGDLGSLFSRFRHWSAPAGDGQQVLRKDG